MDDPTIVIAETGGTPPMTDIERAEEEAAWMEAYATDEEWAAFCETASAEL